MKSNIDKVTEPSTSAEVTTPVANSKKTSVEKVVAEAAVENNDAAVSEVVNYHGTDICEELIEIILPTNKLVGTEVMAAYVLSVFIKLVAKNYGEYFEDENVTMLTHIEAPDECSYITNYDEEGIPVSTELDEDNIDLPELNEACEKMIGHVDGYIFCRTFDFVYDVLLDEGDSEAREKVIKLFEGYLEEAWGFSEVNLMLNIGYVKIKVKR